MKKILLAAFIILFCQFTKAKTVKVCQTCKTNSIKKALNIVSKHDTILLLKSIYIENKIEINKPITIKGIDMPIIDGDGLDIIHIFSDSVYISGIIFRNILTSYSSELAAIHVYKSNSFSIENNILENVFFGFLVEKSSYGKICNNKISSKAKTEYNSGNGIHLWHCNNILIFNNEIWGMRDGIYFEFASESTIQNNHSHNNVRYGLHFMFSNNNEYYQNVFDNNGAGVAVMFSKFINMHHNTFIKNWGSASYGLLLKEIYDAEITENIFDENTIGINTEGCTRINYTHNNFKSNGWAIKISGACYENAFVQNNFISNAFDVSYQGKMNENTFNNNYWSEYTGYDLNKDGLGDIPYRPVKLFSYVVNKTPETIVLLRSLFVDIINFSEKVSPIFTPDNLLDLNPSMKLIE